MSKDIKCSCLLLSKVIPAEMGDSTANPPAIGLFRNMLVTYEADNTQWLYDSICVPTQISEDVEIVQEMGSSTVAVMSQYAVTSAINSVMNAAFDVDKFLAAYDDTSTVVAAKTVDGKLNLFSAAGSFAIYGPYDTLEDVPEPYQVDGFYLIGENSPYVEYIWLIASQQWERIGSTDVDLSDYLNKAATETQVVQPNIAFAKGAELLGTDANDTQHVIGAVKIYDEGEPEELVQTELGNETIHTNINSLDRPTVETPSGKNNIAYLSDINGFASLPVLSADVESTDEVYTVTDIDLPNPLPVGFTFQFIPNVMSSSATATLSINSSTPTTFLTRANYRESGVLGVPSTPGFLTAGTPVVVVYDGGNWLLPTVGLISLTGDVEDVLPVANGGTGSNVVDTTPIFGSTNMVTSGGVYNVIANSMGVIAHGANASAIRPVGFTVVTWIGTAEPENKQTNDVWYNIA